MTFLLIVGWMLSLLFLCDAGGILKIYVMLGAFWKS
jgi:hypothetical protein